MTCVLPAPVLTVEHLFIGEFDISMESPIQLLNCVNVAGVFLGNGRFSQMAAAGRELWAWCLWSISSIWCVLLVWFERKKPNEPANEINQMDQTDKTACGLVAVLRIERGTRGL